jgi:hypothetical protein
MRAFPILFFALSVSVPSLRGEGLEALAVNPEFWAGNEEAIKGPFNDMGFRWTAADRKTARSIDGLSFAEEKVGETILHFDGTVPTQVHISVFNRGDDGRISEERWSEQIEKWTLLLDKLTGVESTEREDKTSAVKANGRMWIDGDVAYLLESSASGAGTSVTPEFIRLRVAPYVEKSLIEEKLDKQEVLSTSRKELPENVVREEGDVFIGGIPMVDQGEKGYCAVATAARVFNYYGAAVTMNELAQIAGSDPQEGTSTRQMIEEMDRVCSRFKTRIKVHKELEVKDIIDTMEDYNKVAERAGKRTWGTTRSIDWGGFLDGSDPELLKESRLKSRGDYEKFEREVIRAIDLGIPLIWTLILGKYEEEGLTPQTAGGHARLIIGYNEENSELIFSDSWGEGHEKKRMSMEDAFCATTGIYSIQPLK